MVKDKDFEKSDTEIYIYESIEELKYRREYHSGQPVVIILGDLNEKEKTVSEYKLCLKDLDVTKFFFS